nr:EOG090X07BN [Sida crystallina]
MDCELINNGSGSQCEQMKEPNLCPNGGKKENRNGLTNGCSRAVDGNVITNSSPQKMNEKETSRPSVDTKNLSSSSSSSVSTSLTGLSCKTVSGDGVDNVVETLSNCDISLNDKVTCVQYQSELQMPDIMRLIQKDLSEPYSIYTYRYFIHNWPKLCFLAMYRNNCVGAIVCKLDMHKKIVRRGYIAMLAVDENYRQKQIGSNLVMQAIAAMVSDGADEVVLETEITNEPALRLYENLGFVRDKRLFRYYLNGVDALRLKLWLR